MSQEWFLTECRRWEQVTAGRDVGQCPSPLWGPPQMWGQDKVSPWASQASSTGPHARV